MKVNIDSTLPCEEKLKAISTLTLNIFRGFFPNMDQKKMAVMLQSCLSNGDIFSASAGRYATIKLARAYMRMKFENWRVLKEMDMSCEGTFNQSSLNHLYRLEECGRGSFAHTHGHSAITPTYAITEARALLNQAIRQVIPIQRNRDPLKAKYGDHVKVDYEEILRLLIKGLGLTEKAVREGVEFVVTSDAARLQSKGNTQHTSAGFRITDADAIDPETGAKLFVDSEGKFTNAQRTTNCALVEMILAPETKEVMLHVMSNIYKYAESIAQYGIPANEVKGLPALKPFVLKVAADMKTQWSLDG